MGFCINNYMKAKFNITETELRDKIIELKTHKAVARYYGSSESLIYQYCKKFNILTPYKEHAKKIENFCRESNLEELLKTYSANYIAKNICPIKTHAGQIIFWANKLGIKTHSIGDSHKLNHVKKSRKDTLIKNYGVDNVSKAEEIKEKKRLSALEKYGVENVFMAEEIKQKSRKTMLEKYGSEHVSGTDLFGLSKLRSHVSKFQESVESILNRHNIEFKSEVANLAKAYNKIMDREYNPRVDIYVEEFNTVIECYGDVWHGNPKKYKPSDIICKYSGDTEVKDIWEFDHERENQIKSFGFNLIIIWEYDMNQNKQKAEQYIINELRKNKQNR